MPSLGASQEQFAESGILSSPSPSRKYGIWPLICATFRNEKQVRSEVSCQSYGAIILLIGNRKPNGYRSSAFEKIALLSAKSTIPKQSGFQELYAGFTSNGLDGGRPNLSQAPLDPEEIDILLALCKAAPLVANKEQASQLLNQLAPYLLEAHVQTYRPSPFLRTIEPSPWEALTFRLTSAILALGLKHHDLHTAVLECTTTYLQNCLSLAGQLVQSSSSTSRSEHGDGYDLASLTVSLLGFLEATSTFADFYSARELLQVVQILRDVFREQFMVSVEGFVSSIRTTESHLRSPLDWKLYIRRYDVAGRPIGTKSLRYSFMKFLVTCSSLQIATAEQLRKADTFQILTSVDGVAFPRSDHATGALVELLASLATESIGLLDNDSDYLRLGSPLEHRLAFSTWALSLHTFVNCMVIDEEIAATETLMSWLEDAMGDPVSMADDMLASYVLKSIAVVSKQSPAIVSSLSKSLPRFIVQGKLRPQTVDVAAWSLTYILKLISQDALITGIYALGNVLSAGSAQGGDRANRNNDQMNGNARFSKLTLPQNQISIHHSTGSSISLGLSDEEEANAAFSNIVRAVVCIAKNSADNKIAALAQSMLLQKLYRVSLAVDLQIIRETATLALTAGESEFKTLLKLHNRVAHEAAKKKDDTLVRAVGSLLEFCRSQLSFLLGSRCKDSHG